MPTTSHAWNCFTFRVLLLSTAASFATTDAFAQTPKADPQIEEIVVTGINYALRQAVEEKRRADAIQDGVSADDLGRLPSKNTSEALAKLPGVNISQDQGEGRYVSIRGASPNLNSITVNGQAVGTVETTSRRVPLDIIGGELLGGVEVIKAITPDMEANAVGGLINVKTVSPLEQKGDFFGRVTGQLGDQELDSFKPIAGTVSVGGKFGSDQNIGATFGVSHTDRHYLTKGLYADDWAIVNGTSRGIPQSHKFNDYDLQRKRTGFNGALEIQPSSGDALYYVRGLVTKTDETEYRYRGRNYFARVTTGLTFTGDNVGTYTNMRMRTEFRDQNTQRRIANFTAGGENTIDRLKLDYSAGLIDNKIDQPTRVWTFQSPDIFSGSFNMTRDYFEVRPNAEQYFANVNRIGINAYSEALTASTDKGSQFKFNARYELEGTEMTGFLKAGALFRSVEKTVDIGSAAYTAGTGGAAAFNVGSPGVWQGAVLEGNVRYQFYQVGPKVDRVGLETFTDAAKTNTVALRADATASLSGSTTGDFKTREKILSGYVMGSVTAGDWTLLGGGRIEQTKVKSNSFDLVNGATVRPVSRDGSYTDFMPGVHVRYVPNDGNFVMRGAWTNTIGRPEYSDIAATRVVTDTVFSPGVFDTTITQGNPDLKAYKSHNFDLSAEYYLPGGGIVSAAAFLKNVNGFIFRETITQRNVTVGGIQYNNLVTTTPRNAQKGKIKGIEFNLQHRLDFLPGWLSGFGGGASLTLVDSKISVAGRTDKLPFVGQADKVYSLIAYYQQGPFEVVGTYAWSDNILFTIGGNKDADLYDAAYGRLDVKSSYRITDNLSVFLELQNLNDEPLGEFQGRPTFVTRKEIYGRTGYIGATYKW